METSALDSILTQLRAAQAATRPSDAAQKPAQPVKGEPGSFSQVLRNAIDSVNDTQMTSSDMQKAFELGDPDIDLQDVMVQMAKANISFQTMIQVRNRIISAYQDVMNMPV
jgi:flagellar hook-basal body complex protein FliE